VPRYILDTNLYVRAVRDKAAAEAVAGFYEAFLPFTYLHAVVAHELLAGAVSPEAGRRVFEALVLPFERTGRVITPTWRTWRRGAELIAGLVHRRLATRGGLRQSFTNDALLAASCREHGLTLITENARDFARLQRVERFEFVPPWPGRIR
jgi:predicted nucleic acid-binding protein